MPFIKFIATHKITNHELLHTDSGKAKIFKAVIKLIEFLEKDSVNALKNSKIKNKWLVMRITSFFCSLYLNQKIK